MVSTSPSSVSPGRRSRSDRTRRASLILLRRPRPASAGSPYEAVRWAYRTGILGGRNPSSRVCLRRGLKLGGGTKLKGRKRPTWRAPVGQSAHGSCWEHAVLTAGSLRPTGQRSGHSRSTPRPSPTRRLAKCRATTTPLRNLVWVEERPSELRLQGSGLRPDAANSRVLIGLLTCSSAIPGREMDERHAS